jgi:hypothetical protein
MHGRSRFKRAKRIVIAGWRYAVLAAGVQRQRARRQHFLAALAVMRNEAPVIREWIESHLREGIEHFYLIDHGSTDDWRERIADHLKAGRVSVIVGRGDNVDDVRVDGARAALRACEWLLILDLDEFTYVRGEGTIADFLRTLPSDVAQVKVPWLIFGTNSNIEQPSSVVRSCRLRESLDSRPDQRWLVKSIVRPERLLLFKIHAHSVFGRTVAPLPGLPECDEEPFLPWHWRSREPELLLAQNHYILQSRQQFEEKARRTGYGPTPKYTEEYFQNTECWANVTQDDLLYTKHLQALPSRSNRVAPNTLS